MKLNLDDAGHVVVSDGKPVYVDDNGKDIAFDAPHTVATIARLNGEAKGHRERAEDAEGKLAAFKDITDPAAAIKALNTVKNLNDKQLVDAGEVERVKAAAIEAVEAKYKPILEERDKLLGENKAEKLGNAFGKSKVITDKLILPAAAAQKLFGEHFNVENGKIVAKDYHGNVINSKSRPGDPADFDEAMEALIDGYAHKDAVLKGTGNQGDGARHSNGSGPSAADLAKLSPVERINAARAAQGTK
jgi:hypothetical protein